MGNEAVAVSPEPARAAPGASLVPFRIRLYAGESNFVAGTWLRSYLSSPWGKRVSKDEYYKFHAPLVSQLIDRSTVWVAESAHAESHGLLLGFIAGERDEHGACVHYAYVKGDYRMRGVGKALAHALLATIQKRENELVRYSHSRSPGSDIAGRLGWQYTPYPALRFGWDNRTVRP